MSVHEEAEAVPVAAEAEPVVAEVEHEEEHVQLSPPQPSWLHTIMRTLTKVAGELLCLCLSTLLWLPPA